MAVLAGVEVAVGIGAERSVEFGHEVGAEDVGLIQGFVHADGGLLQIHIVGQGLLHQGVEPAVAEALPPVAFGLVGAAGGIGAAAAFTGGGLHAALAPGLGETDLGVGGLVDGAAGEQQGQRGGANGWDGWGDRFHKPSFLGWAFGWVAGSPGGLEAT